MSSEELEQLQQNIGQFVSVNSFLSTSKERLIAEFYMGDRTQQTNLERVLFEIDADPKVVSTKPFADISILSHFADEFEVLFMLGSIFRLNFINHDDDRMWIIGMSLCGDDEHNLKEVLDDMKRQNGIGETTLWSLGKLLWTMGKLDLAEQYYSRLLRELSPDEPSRHSLYADLGVIASMQGDYDKSMQWRQKLLELREQTAQSDGINKGETIRAIY
jgi:tetratricopeptide (TPR) repeat protein